MKAIKSLRQALEEASEVGLTSSEIKDLLAIYPEPEISYQWGLEVSEFLTVPFPNRESAVSASGNANRLVKRTPGSTPGPWVSA